MNTEVRKESDSFVEWTKGEKSKAKEATKGGYIDGTSCLVPDYSRAAPTTATKARVPIATCSCEPALLESDTALTLVEAVLVDLVVVSVDVCVEVVRDEVYVPDIDAEADEGYVDPDALISKVSEVA